MNKILKTLLSTAVISAVALSAATVFAAETDGETYYFENFNSGWNINAGDETTANEGFNDSWKKSGANVTIIRGGTEEDSYLGFKKEATGTAAQNAFVSKDKMLDGFNLYNFVGKLVFSYDMFVPTIETFKNNGLTAATTFTQVTALKFNYNDGTTNRFVHMANMPTPRVCPENFTIGASKYARDLYVTNMGGNYDGATESRIVVKNNGNVSSGGYVTIGDHGGTWIPFTIIIDKPTVGIEWELKYFIGNEFMAQGSYEFDDEGNKKTTYSGWAGGSYFRIRDYKQYNGQPLPGIDNPAVTGYFSFETQGEASGTSNTYLAIDNLSLRIYDEPTLSATTEVKQGEKTAAVKVFNSGVADTASDDAKAGYLVLDAINSLGTFSVVEYESDDIYYENGTVKTYGLSANYKDTIATQTSSVWAGADNRMIRTNDGRILNLNLSDEIVEGLEAGKRYRITLNGAYDMLTGFHNLYSTQFKQMQYVQRGIEMTENNSTLLWMGEAPKFVSISFSDISNNTITAKDQRYKTNKITLNTLDESEKTYIVYRGEEELTTTQTFKGGTYTISLPDNKIIGAGTTLVIKCDGETMISMDMPAVDEVEYGAVEPDGNYPSVWYCNPTSSTKQIYLVSSANDASGAAAGTVTVSGPHNIAPYTNKKIKGSYPMSAPTDGLAMFEGFKLDTVTKNTAVITNLLVDPSTLKANVEFKLGAENADAAANVAIFQGDWDKAEDMPADEATAISKMKSVNTVIANELGSVTKEFSFANFTRGIKYTMVVYVGSEAYYNTFSVVHKDDATTAVGNLNGLTTQDDVLGFINNDANKEYLSLNSDVYDSLSNQGAVAAMMLTYGNFATPLDATKAYRESAVVQGFNEGKISNIANVMSDISALHNTPIGAWLDLKADVEPDRTAAWRTDVTARLNGRTSRTSRAAVSPIDEFNSDLYAAMAYAQIANPESVDVLYDFLSTYASTIGITSQYVITDTVSKVSGTVYTGCDISALNTDLEKYYKEYSYTPPAGGGGGGGGGSTPPRLDVSVETPTGGNTPIVTPPSGPVEIFNDLGAFDWAKPAITNLFNRGIINGKGDGQYAPLDNVTREEFTKMVVTALGLNTIDARAAFGDVSDKDWFAPYIKAAVDNGIVSGQSDDKFGVGENITRQDMAVILANALKYLDKTTEGTGNSFKDASDVSDYAVNAVDTLSAAGIINGYEDGTFQPLNSANRAEAAKVIYGFLVAYGL